MGLRCHKTQIINKYFNQFILSNSHERIYKMRAGDSLQVLVLAYDSLVWMKPVQSCLYPGGALFED